MLGLYKFALQGYKYLSTHATYVQNCKGGKLVTKISFLVGQQS